MGAGYLRSLAALRKLRPLLTKELYDAFLMAASTSDTAKGMQALLDGTVDALGRLPGPAALQSKQAEVAIRFVVPGKEKGEIYLLENPLVRLEGDGQVATALVQQSSGGFLKSFVSVPDLIEAGARLDITYDYESEGLPCDIARKGYLTDYKSLYYGVMQMAE